MLDYIFFLKVILSFIIGGSIISLFISLGERTKAKYAGFLLGLPITSAVGLFFIGFTQSAEAASEAVTIMPITLAMGFVFLLSFLKLHSKFGAVKSIIISTLIFCLFSAAFAYLNFTNIFLNSAIFLFAALFTFIYTRKFAEAKASSRAGKNEIIARALFAGAIIAMAVIAAKLFGSLWGGVFAAFPATYISTMYISVKRHSIGFAKSVVRGIPSGILGTLAYYFVVYYLYPVYGIFLGTIIGYAIAIAFPLALKFAYNSIAKN